MRLNLRLAHLALSVDASKTGTAGKRGSLQIKGDQGKRGIQPCVIKATERQGLLKDGVRFAESPWKIMNFRTCTL